MFEPGELIGPYVLIAPIGAGGMGQVFRAHDARLARDVAIKVLPDTSSQDEKARLRFEREAKAIAALSHPNIVAIYDFGNHDGNLYIVTELLHGTDLRGALAETLSIRQVLEIAAAICHGLAAAHDKGIIHRDLKPENVFITRDKGVKVLDFGLARVQSRGEIGSDAPTMRIHTSPGTVMGTAGYMSPEQVRGIELDHRSDIFAFGAILYEMLSGRRAFTGASSVETMNAILREEPPELSESGRMIVPALDSIVRRCLEKKPEHRFQSAHDLAFALQSLQSPSGTARIVPAIGEARGRRPLLAALALLGVLLLLALFVVVMRRGPGNVPPVFRRITFQRGLVHAARFSSDGHTIIYSAEWNGGPPEIYSTRVDSTESRPMAMGKAALLALSSSDQLAIARNPVSAATEVYWTVWSGTMGVGSLAGGLPHDVLEDVEFADYGPDGHTLAVVRSVKGKRILEYPIGKPLYSTVGWIGEPRISPDGERVCFFDHPTNGAPEAVLSVVDRGGKKTILASGFLRAEGLAWTADGQEVWVTATRSGSARVLYAERAGGKERLIARVPGALTIHDISRDGRVLLGYEDIRRGISAHGRGTNGERDLAWLDLSVLQGISGDGSKIAIAEYGEGGGTGRKTYIRKMDGSPASLIAEGYSTCGLTRDGKWVVAFSELLSPHPRMVLLPAGPGQILTLPTVPMNYQIAALAPDDGTMYFSAEQPGHALRTYVQNVSGGAPQAVTPEGTAWRYPETFLPVSSDGQTIVVRDAGGKALLWSLNNAKPREIPGFDSATEMALQFSADGRSLYVDRLRGGSNRLCRLDLQTGSHDSCIDLKPPDPVGLVAIDYVSVTPDGQSYAYSFVRRTCDLYVVEGLK